MQRLFTYGWQQQQQQQSQSHDGSGSSTPRRGGAGSLAGGVRATPVSPIAAAADALRQLKVGGTATNASRAAAGGRYRPPHARPQRSSSDAPLPPSAGDDSAAPLPDQQQLDSSDSESSDAEGVGAASGGSLERYRSSRVRCGALACLQLLAKADARALHGSWTTLLPLSDAVSCRR